MLPKRIFTVIFTSFVLRRALSIKMSVKGHGAIDLVSSVIIRFSRLTRVGSALVPTDNSPQTASPQTASLNGQAYELRSLFLVDAIPTPSRVTGMISSSTKLTTGGL